ncbi:hypothetical protein PLICRDRAFT_384587 [Plicaturopsis crispa FD-325 SS-3]|nr:hypothetical protein PLICRDRAFT_384587 [Plicaturopsis crispa FD-325 SS-3]
MPPAQAGSRPFPFPSARVRARRGNSPRGRGGRDRRAPSRPGCPSSLRPCRRPGHTGTRAAGALRGAGAGAGATRAVWRGARWRGAPGRWARCGAGPRVMAMVRR